MTKTQIREVIIDRLRIVDGQSNSYYISHHDGVLRGLIWVLTGEDPGIELTRDVERLLTIAGIPCERHGDTIHYGESRVALREYVDARY